jgi:hypothetical protein
MKLDWLVLLSVALCAIVLAGELMAYGIDPYNYDADAEFEDGSVSVSITTSGANNYSVVVLDNSAHPAPLQLYIYHDERYDESLKEARSAIGPFGHDLSYSIDQLSRALKVRGFDDIMILNDEQLLEAMSGDVSGSVSKGLLVMSYALPESVYSGSEDSLLFEWIDRGGSLYWMSSPIGMFYRGESGIVLVDNNQELFFGRECVNMGGTDHAMSVTGGGLTGALFLSWNRVLYGLDASEIGGSFSMGYSQDGYSSVSMVPFGDGMICVIGGNYNRHQCDDAAQIIASGVSCFSKVLTTDAGSIEKGTSEFLYEVPYGTADVSVYVSIGGYYTVFGRAIKC